MQGTNGSWLRAFVVFLGLIGLAALGVGLYGIYRQQTAPTPSTPPTPNYPPYSWSITGTVTSKYIAVALPQLATSFVIVVDTPSGQFHFAADIAYWTVVQPGMQVTIFFGPNTTMLVRGVVIPIWRCDP